MNATTKTKIQMPTLHKSQRQVRQHPARFKVLDCGRRWGKTRLGVAMCIGAALAGGRAWWIAPSFPMSEVGWRGLKQLAQGIPRAETREVTRMIRFPSGGWAQVRSADHPDSLRGEGLDLVLLDECAFLQEDTWTRSLRPALADRKGKGVFISTPKGRNFFWRLWQKGQEGDPEWYSWKLPTADNPFIDPTEIASAQAILPERIFRQEFLADFIEEGAGVFRGIFSAATAVPQDRAIAGHDYVIGCDWGRAEDYTVFAVVDLQEKALVHLDRSNRVEYALQRGRLKALAEKFRPRFILAEANAMGEPIIEQLRRDGLPVKPFFTTNATKAAVIDGLALAFEREQIQILHDPVLLGELDGFTSERLPSGLFRYGAPSGLHDDTVIALALAWEQAFGGRKWRPEGMMV